MLKEGGGGAARETGEERDRAGAARGTRLGIRALPAGRSLVVPGETSSSDSLYLLSYILWGPSFALGQWCALPQSLELTIEETEWILFSLKTGGSWDWCNVAVIGAQKYELFSFERAGHTIGFEAVGMNTVVCVDGGAGQAFCHHLHLQTVPCGSQ